MSAAMAAMALTILTTATKAISGAAGLDTCAGSDDSVDWVSRAVDGVSLLVVAAAVLLLLRIVVWLGLGLRFSCKGLAADANPPCIHASSRVDAVMPTNAGDMRSRAAVMVTQKGSFYHIDTDCYHVRGRIYKTYLPCKHCTSAFLTGSGQ